MSSLATLSPASTYGSLLQIATNGQGLLSTPAQIQDGLGNLTLMTISTNLINFDRSIGQFQVDGVALTADINTLNNISDVANATYILLSPNDQLQNALTLAVTSGLSLTPSGGTCTISPALELAGIQALNTTGLVVRTAPSTYSSVTLVSDGTLNITNESGITGSPSFSVVSDTNRQRVNSQLNGVFQSQKSQLNFIPGPNIGIIVDDNPAQNRTDIILSSFFNAGVIFKASCYAGSTVNLNVVYNNGAEGFGATLTNNGALVAFSIDGVSPPLNSRILVKNQTSEFQNGIYVLTTVGSNAVAWVLTRSTDFNSNTNIQVGDFTFTINGVINAGLGWIQIDQVNTVGTDSINFTQFALTGTVTNVSGTPGEIVVVDPTTTPVISIDPTYIGQTSITTLGIIATGTWEGNTVDVPYGGTGETTFTAYSLICAGTTATGNFQNVAGLGTLGQVLTSTGAAALPAWQNPTSVAFQLAINQLGHGLNVGNIIRCTGSNTFVLALADNAGDAEVVGIVVSVQNDNNFTFQFGGIVSGLTVTAGDVYFLSPSVAGTITSTAPSTQGQVNKPLLIALTATTGLWINQRGQVL